jgi:beta-galactosidase
MKLIDIQNDIIKIILFIVYMSISLNASNNETIRKTENFNKDWKFNLGDVTNGQDIKLDDSNWRELNLPHDWSIEGKFDKDNPATVGGGALPGGIGWYRKSFTIPETDKDKLIFIEFDGVYRNSEVWINNNYLGKRPYGYSSFRYELTPFLKYGNENNIICVKVDNSQLPNSRWYSGSGIYRNVRLVTTNKISVDHWGTYITTPIINKNIAFVTIQTKVRNASGKSQSIKLINEIFDVDEKSISTTSTVVSLTDNSNNEITQYLDIKNPILWDVDNPYLYKVVTKIEVNGEVCDEYLTSLGVRYFNFDVETGFSLNGKNIKINGVCNHHDLGCLGAAINTRALERQIEILKGMGVNSIRTSHNPPAPELLDLCDKMGILVMDEAFDMWAKNKNPYDYAVDWNEWHQRDMQDLILRDRNHPSVFIWSIGNEIIEQWDQKDISGTLIAKELASIIKNLDQTRPITSACNGVDPTNPLIRSGALDLIGLNYHQETFKDFPSIYPGHKFIGTETVSSLATRGHYDMPSDSIRRWPARWDLPLEDGNKDNTCSAYDNCSAPWGSTQEETWKIIKKYDFLSGQYIWTGFDYLGEPTPYPWPSRSSYFGIIDLAGFPKDTYYMYQSEWTNKNVLHIFPLWNWKSGDVVDVWAYTNCDEVELFLNEKSLGTKSKIGDQLHLTWKVPFTEGTLKAIGKKNEKEILVEEIKTAGKPAKIFLEADRNIMTADGVDLSFVTVKIFDKNNNVVPYADNLINFNITGEGKIIGVDNGCQTNLQSFKEKYVNAFNGKCLVVIQSTEKSGTIKLTATSDNLSKTEIIIKTQEK